MTHEKTHRGTHKFDSHCIVLNPANDEENNYLKKIRNELSGNGEVTDLPFNAAKEEVSEFLDKHQLLPSEKDKLLTYILDAVRKESPEIKVSSLEQLFEPIAHDFSYLLTHIRTHAETFEKDARYIYLPHKRILAKYVGHELHRALSQTRFLGLIPLKAIEIIRSLRIGSIGASVAGGSLDQLVSIGTEHINCYDEGFLAPSNQPRMSRGSFLDNGLSKVFVVAGQLSERNPYGVFRGIQGRVITDESDRKSEYDVTFEMFAKEHDIFLEVADAPHIKAGFRKFMADTYPSKPVFFIADVGNNPFSNIEIPKLGNYFGQQINYEQLERLSIPPTSAPQAMSAVYEMVKNDFPSDHKVQYLLARLGISGFWSQTPISMRESAALTAKLLISYVLGNGITNQNITTSKSINHFFEYTDEDQQTLERIYEQFFPKVH